MHERCGRRRPHVKQRVAWSGRGARPCDRRRFNSGGRRSRKGQRQAGRGITVSIRGITVSISVHWRRIMRARPPIVRPGIAITPSWAARIISVPATMPATAAVPTTTAATVPTAAFRERRCGCADKQTNAHGREKNGTMCHFYLPPVRLITGSSSNLVTNHGDVWALSCQFVSQLPFAT
jgi:hypothetical protein